MSLRSLLIACACATAAAAPTHSSAWQVTVDVFEGTLEGACAHRSSDSPWDTVCPQPRAPALSLHALARSLDAPP